MLLVHPKQLTISIENKLLSVLHRFFGTLVCPPCRESCSADTRTGCLLRVFSLDRCKVVRAESPHPPSLPPTTYPLALRKKPRGDVLPSQRATPCGCDRYLRPRPRARLSQTSRKAIGPDKRARLIGIWESKHPPGNPHSENATSQDLARNLLLLTVVDYGRCPYLSANAQKV